MNVLIVGGGIAGTSCAEELRKLNSKAEITIISEENHPLYSRVLLPHYAIGKVEREKCFLKSEKWYQDQNIELLLGQRVVRLDTKNKFVELDDARELSYDKLVIAGGTEPRTVSGEPKGVVYFWALDDVDHMLSVINGLKHEAFKTQAVVHGGGFIACEFINVFRNHDIDTVVTFRGKHFWNKILNDQAGLLIQNHLEQSGIQILPKAELVGARGDQDLKAVDTTKGDLPCSLLGVAIGNTPETRWLADSGIEINQGIKTDEFLETNVENIFAIGDIAESYDLVAGRQYSAGNWGRAMMQGRTVAKTIAGERTAYEQVSSYAINLLGLDITFIGDTNKRAADDVVVWGSVDQGALTQIFVRNEKVVGAATIGRNQDRKILTEAIQNKQGIPGLK